MEENSELEEGEASGHGDNGDSYKDNCNNDNMEIDVDSSYIDDKIQNVLGHFQKDFEGDISAENLGSKYGAYGTFLPTYERCPCTLSCSKTPQRVSGLPNPKNWPMEGAFQSFKAPSNASSSSRLGTASLSSNGQHNTGAMSKDAPPQLEPGPSCVLEAHKPTSKNIKSNKSDNLSDQRTLKFRIKVISETAAIYAGLGLDNSPSPSSGNSSEESDDTLGGPQDRADESPTYILHVMTSFTVPDVGLISPLHESLLSLIRKERFFRENQSAPSIKRTQECSSLVDESISVLGNCKEPKEEKKVPGKNVTSDVNFENDMGIAISSRKRSEEDASEGNKVRAKLSPYCMEEHLFEYGGNSEMKIAQSYSMENTSRQKESICNKDDWRDTKSITKCKEVSTKSSALSEASSDAFKCKEGLKVRSTKSSKKTQQRSGQQVALNPLDESAMSSEKERSLLDGRKPQDSATGEKTANVFLKGSLKVGKGIKSRHALVADVSSKGSLKVGEGIKSRHALVADVSSKGSSLVSKGTKSKQTFIANHGASTCKDRMKHAGKAIDNQRRSLDKHLEPTTDVIVSRKRPSAEKDRVSSIGNLGIKCVASVHQSKESSSVQGVDNQLVSRPNVNASAFDGLSAMENAAALEGLPKIDWVQCDSCEKWRMLPFCIKPDQLPDIWTCSMSYWIPGMNRCDISADETTKAVTELDQKNNLQNLSSGVARSYQSINTIAMSSLGKEKPGLKDIGKACSTHGPIQRLNYAKNCIEDSKKSRSVDDVSLPPEGSNLRNKSGLYHSTKSENLVLEKHFPELKRGDAKQANKKNKTAYGFGNSNNIKIEDTDDYDERKNSNVGSGMVSLNSKSSSSTKVGRKDMQIPSKYSFVEDVKDETQERLLISLKLGKQVQPQVSSDGGSSDVRRNASVKKRKVLETQADQDGHDDSKTHTESCSKKAKICKIPKPAGKEPFTNGDDDSLNGKDQVTHTLLSGSKNHPSDGMEEGRTSNKDQQPHKHKRKCVFGQTLNDATSLRKVVGSTQVSVTATSSSSKVSNSLKTRAILDDVKASPIGAVSSSPLRASIPGRLSSAGGDINVGSLARKSRRCSYEESYDKLNQSGAAMKERASDSFHPQPNESVLLDCQGRGSNEKNAQKAEFAALPRRGAEVIEDHHTSSGHCHNEIRADKKQSIRVLFPQKSSKKSSLGPKDKIKSSTSCTDKVIELSDSASRQEDSFSSKIHLKSLASFDGKVDNVEHSIDDKLRAESSKDGKEHANRTDSGGQYPEDSRIANQSKLQELHDSNPRANTFCKKSNASFLKESDRDFEGEIKVDSAIRESRNRMADGEGRNGAHCHQSALSIRQGGASDKLPNHTSGTGDMSKALRLPGNAAIKNTTGQSIGNHVPDSRGVRDLNASNPGMLGIPSQIATNALNEAKKLSDQADHLKSSGLIFESNEAYFQAALKFLFGAYLQEAQSSEENQLRESTQIQVYNTTARLCKNCALEYESHGDMAAAALAYKCLEVACWRVVYCKTSTSIRDHSELQACFQMSAQGDSPSSSTSDVDNLNNQSTVDRTSLVKGAALHVVRSPVFVARNFLRLLEFTQDVNSAVEASRKCQKSLSAANVTMQEAKRRECIASVKKAIDFSFQDIEGFIHSVQFAMKSISH